MKTANIQLAGSVLTRDATNYAGRDQQFTNCFSYGVGDALTGGSRIFTQKRKGMASTAVSGVSGGKRGACIWTNQQKLAMSYLKTGGTDIQVFDQTQTQIGGDIATTSDCFSLYEAMVGTTPTLVGVFRDSTFLGIEGWYFPLAGAWTQITDGDFPAQISRFSPPVQKDGYLFWMTEAGLLVNSDLNSVSSYSANNSIAAQSMPDAGVGVGVSGGYIVAFGSYSIELFRNAGNPTGSPLSSVPNSVTRIGVAYSYITTIGNSIYFQGINSETGDRGIYRMTDAKATKISTPDIDKYMTQNNIWSCIGSIKDGGMEHILFSHETSEIFAYCTNNNRWWRFLGASNEGILAALSIGDQLTYLSASASAKMYSISNTSTEWRDDSVNQTMTIQTQPIDFGTGKYKYPSQIRLFGDKQSSTCNVAMSYSDDDAITFSTPVNMDMSTNSPAVFNPLGRFRRRVWKFTNTVNVPLRLERFEVDYEVGVT